MKHINVTPILDTVKATEASRIRSALSKTDGIYKFPCNNRPSVEFYGGAGPAIAEVDNIRIDDNGSVILLVLDDESNGERRYEVGLDSLYPGSLSAVMDLMDDNDGNPSELAERKIIRETWHYIGTLHRQTLLDNIKAVLRDILKSGASSVNVSDLHTEGLLDRIGKYCTPKDYAHNFILHEYALEDGKLSVTSNDEGCEYVFSEYDFSIDELEDILDQLEEVLGGINDGEFSIGKDGRVEPMAEKSTPNEKFSVKVHWDVCYRVDVEASSEEDAVEKARELAMVAPSSEYEWLEETDVSVSPASR